MFSRRWNKVHVQHDCNTGGSTIIAKREFLAIKTRPSGRISATGVGLHAHAAHGPPARDHSGVGGGQLHDGLRHESSRVSFYKAGFSPPFTAGVAHRLLLPRR